MTQDEIKRICEKRFLELGANKLNYSHLVNVGH